MKRQAGAFRRGRWGEFVAERFLKARGWRILSRNWRDGPRELDLVARKGPTLAFVEVKTRGGGRNAAHPLESLTWRKRREVERAARAWLGWYRESRKAEPGVRGSAAAVGPVGGRGPDGPRLESWPADIRFDAIVVRLEPGRSPRVEHVPDAWRPGWDRR